MMAKITISEDYLLDSLFPGETLLLRSIDFDGSRITLDIDGAEVPKCERVSVEITVAQKTHKFVAVPEWGLASRSFLSPNTPVVQSK
jgi:hypothetical protein